MTDDMLPPTEEEFRIARELAKRDDSIGEWAYQVCRWFRGQLFKPDEAQICLTAIRDKTAE